MRKKTAELIHQKKLLKSEAAAPLPSDKGQNKGERKENHIGVGNDWQVSRKV